VLPKKVLFSLKIIAKKFGYVKNYYYLCSALGDPLVPPQRGMIGSHYSVVKPLLSPPEGGRI